MKVKIFLVILAMLPVFISSAQDNFSLFTSTNWQRTDSLSNRLNDYYIFDKNDLYMVEIKAGESHYRGPFVFYFSDNPDEAFDETKLNNKSGKYFIHKRGKTRVSVYEIISLSNDEFIIDYLPSEMVIGSPIIRRTYRSFNGNLPPREPE